MLDGSPDGLTIEAINNALVGLGRPGWLWRRSMATPSNLRLHRRRRGRLAARVRIERPVPVIKLPGLTLLPLQESSLPLIATLLGTKFIQTHPTRSPAPQAETAALIGLSSTTVVSLGQGPFGNSPRYDLEGNDGLLARANDPVLPPDHDRAGWKRAMIGLDEAFEEFRRATQPKPSPKNGPEADDDDPSADQDPPADLFESTITFRDPLARKVRRRRHQLAQDGGPRPAAPPGASPGAAASLTRSRREPIPLTWLTWLALAIPPGGILTASSCPSHRFRKPHAATAGRSTSARRLGPFARFDRFF